MSYYTVDKYDLSRLKDELLALFCGRQKSGAWFALLDTAFTHGSKVNWSAEEMWPVYCEGRLEDLKSVSPCLLPLSTGDGERLESELTQLLRRCQGRPMLSFIHSEKAPQDICQSWQNVLEIETSDAQKFLLRFADSRITPVLANGFPASVWARLSKGIDQWRYIDREGRLQCLAVAGPLADISLDQALVRISDQELSRLLESSQADALADVLHESFPDVLPAEQGAAVHYRLAAICELAARRGMDSFSHLMTLAVAVCLSDGLLLENETFLKWLDGRPWTSGDFAEAIDQFVG